MVEDRPCSDCEKVPRLVAHDGELYVACGCDTALKVARDDPDHYAPEEWTR